MRRTSGSRIKSTTTCGETVSVDQPAGSRHLPASCPASLRRRCPSFCPASLPTHLCCMLCVTRMCLLAPAVVPFAWCPLHAEHGTQKQALPTCLPSYPMPACLLACLPLRLSLQAAWSC
jgi:hypothetical protein